MFLPFVHQLGRHLSGFKEQPAWLTIGQVLDIDAAEIAAGATSGSAARAAAGRAILTPSGQRRDLPAPVAAAPGATAPPAAALELTEQGFYEIRGSGRDAGPTIVAASNVNLAESNLDRMDPKELVAAVTGNGPSGSTSGQDVLPDEAQELAQRVWWYLLFAGILLLDRRDGAGASLFTRHAMSKRSLEPWNAWNLWNRENQPMGEVNARAQLLEVVRQVRRRWRIKLALRGAVGFLLAGADRDPRDRLHARGAEVHARRDLLVPHRHRRSSSSPPARGSSRGRCRARSPTNRSRCISKSTSRRSIPRSSARWKRPSGPATGRRS